MSEPMTEAEQAVVDVLEGDSECSWHKGCDVEDCYGPRAAAIIAKLRPILAAEFRKAAGDTLAGLAPQQATPDARDAFWRASALTRSKASTAAALRTTTSEETR